MSPPLPRYTDRPLPPYRFIPGRRPHPTKSPQGHSYHAAEIPGKLDPSDWGSCERYLYAVDLFNNRYYWEAHETLEPLWTDAGRDSPTGMFLQGLIKVSAAFLKHAMGNQDGAVRHMENGCKTLMGIEGVFLGIDCVDLSVRVGDFIAGRTDEPPGIVLKT